MGEEKSITLSHDLSTLVVQLLISSPKTKAALYPSVSLAYTAGAQHSWGKWMNITRKTRC